MKNKVWKEMAEILKNKGINCSVLVFVKEQKYIKKLSEEYQTNSQDKQELGAWERIHKRLNFWMDVCREYKLSEDFMREFVDSLHWPHTSANQKMSIEFVRDFKHLILWDWHSHRTDFTFDFIFEFEDYLDMYRIVNNKDYSFCRNDDSYFGGYNNFSMKEYKEYIEQFRIKSRWEILDL